MAFWNQNSLNYIATLSTLESTFRDKNIRYASRWLILAQDAKFRVRQFQVIYLHTTHLGLHKDTVLAFFPELMKERTRNAGLVVYVFIACKTTHLKESINCFCHSNDFQNGVNRFLKMVNHFLPKTQNFVYIYIYYHTILFKFHQHMVQILIK